MPPITSSRPGARLTRIGRAKSNSADSSSRVRRSSVGTGSRLRSSRAGERCGDGGARLGARSVTWPGGREGCRGEGVGTRSLLLRRFPFQNDLVEEPPAAGQLELGRQHVSLGRDNLRALELEEVSAAGAVPAVALLVEGFQVPDPRVAHALAAPLGVVGAIVEQLEDDASGRLGRIAE